MTEYHTAYQRGEGESTQWEDIQRKLGNFKPVEKPWKPDKFQPKQETDRGGQGWLAQQEDPAELREAEDDFADDAFLEQYRQRRLAELSATASRPHFGSVTQITKDQFVAEVTKASEEVWVVVHLYKDKVGDCGLLAQCLDELAVTHPGTKFVKIISTDCIPKYPDQNLPTVLLYRNTQLKQHLVGLLLYGGRNTTSAGVLRAFNAFGDVCSQPDSKVQSQQQ